MNSWTFLLIAFFSGIDSSLYIHMMYVAIVVVFVSHLIIPDSISFSVTRSFIKHR